MPNRNSLDPWQLLSDRLTPGRRDKMLEVAKNRTNYISLIVQDVHNPHNVSACMRSAEAFGVLNIHTVQLKNAFKASTVARGVGHWLNIHTYSDIKSCAESLKSQGYLIAAGMPPQEGVLPLQELPLKNPIAVLFGNEHEGVSPEWEKYCDLRFTIPMRGMVESLNISVSAAITLQNLTQRALSDVNIGSYHLNQGEQRSLLNGWIRQQIPSWQQECERLTTNPPDGFMKP